MKRIKKIIAPLAIGMFLLIGSSVRADFPPPPPMPGQGHGFGQDSQPMVPAPIDGGLSILLALGAFYGGKKVYKATRSSEVAK